jgi:hypothetical protein
VAWSGGRRMRCAECADAELVDLTKYGSHVYVLVRRDELRASKIMAKRLVAHPKVTVLWNVSESCGLFTCYPTFLPLLAMRPLPAFLLLASWFRDGSRALEYGMVASVRLYACGVTLVACTRPSPRAVLTALIRPSRPSARATAICSRASRSRTPRRARPASCP